MIIQIKSVLYVIFNISNSSRYIFLIFKKIWTLEPYTNIYINNPIPKTLQYLRFFKIFPITHHQGTQIYIFTHSTPTFLVFTHKKVTTSPTYKFHRVKTHFKRTQTFDTRSIWLAPDLLSTPTQFKPNPHNTIRILNFNIIVLLRPLSNSRVLVSLMPNPRNQILMGYKGVIIKVPAPVSPVVYLLFENSRRSRCVCIFYVSE